MISNERPSPFRQRQPFVRTKPQVVEVVLKSESLNVERKTFFLTLAENARGRFLRVAESCNGYHHNMIVMPTSGLEEFQRMLAEMGKAANELPPAI
jgi:hypothetical protein